MSQPNTTEKETPTQFDIHPLIKERWSPRSFSEKAISEKEVKTLLEAGRWAPSSSNMQPWNIIWGIKGTQTYDRIFSCLHEFNQGWAGNAQVLWACAFRKDMPTQDKENFHALHDLGLFMSNVYTQAQSMGIAVHQMAGIDFNKAQKEFNFPDNYHVATAAAFGYYGGDPAILDEDLKKEELKKERSRKSQDEFAFNGNFQK
ncbi:nitroreductase family protein [uncultured Marixanthomonas sp.]|uniref:nitroreductase family protein n=1 Tax=uncultured Marixanthomonas sp. TaxID=757245 RepID=UPI0030DBFE42|tara:strand:+ start:29968 stop:30573 length:606 start_codon:yes stop_codon:yes gene_type:complete